jgi:hypothetical protein
MQGLAACSLVPTNGRFGLAVQRTASRAHKEHYYMYFAIATRPAKTRECPIAVALIKVHGHALG